MTGQNEPGLSKSQIRGLLILLLIICLFVGGRFLWNRADQTDLVLTEEKKDQKDYPDTKTAKIPNIEINSATPEELEQLPGIGPVHSKRIVKYREAIGGFKRIDDLKKVYGLPEETFESIRPHLTLKRVDSGGKERVGLGNENKDSELIEPLELNSADSASLEALPMIGPVLSQRIINYRDAIGGFSSVEDLKKVYGLSEETFDIIEPFVFVNPVSKVEEKTKTKEEVVLVDINLADSAALIQIRGIGEKLSGRIIRFRDKLGFFHSVNQLSEVWGLSNENFELIKTQVFVGNNLNQLPHLRINSVTKDQLASHPYVNYKEAAAIIKYREQHGEYKSLEDLEKLYALEKETISKIGPYLQF